MRQLRGESITSGINVYTPWITVVTIIGVVSVDRTLCQTLVRGEGRSSANPQLNFRFQILA